MYRILFNRPFAFLFSAQIVALLGTGLLTVALGFLAFDLAGDQAGAVLGIAYSIKMIAYVGLAPIANVIAERLPRKAVLVGADLVRASVALCLPFIETLWQVYTLIFILQAASATFTPAFQAVIPDILKDEKDYTNALSLSRLAYDLENLLSPVLAGALLVIMSYHWLFTGTVIGFLGSALLVFATSLPPWQAAPKQRSFVDRLTWGTRIYLATPRLRGLLSLNMVAAAASAFVLVNTIVMVRSEFGAGDAEVALALACFGGGSMLAAFTLPRILHAVSERHIMMLAGICLTILMLMHGTVYAISGLVPWYAFLIIWALTGFFFASILTPSGRLLRRSAHNQDRPAVFAAQFALSHACWLVTYPVAGWVGSTYGMPAAMLALGGACLAGLLSAIRLWPAQALKEEPHAHPDLPLDHPHFKEYEPTGNRHRHVFVIDAEHLIWPRQG